jgi:predicted O-methyltransferase YrrM
VNPLRSSLRWACDALINLSPGLFLDSLRRNHFELVIREFNRAYLFDWGQASFLDRLECFEDLVPLFGLTPLGRGIIRQDFDEAAALFKVIRNMPGARGVEIGRFNGGSTLLLAVAVGRYGKLVSIDVGPQNDGLLQKILCPTNLFPRVELIVGDANLVERNEPFDFVFIDGDHSYEGARRDHNRWGRRVRQGGLIIHHDMASSRPYSTQWEDLARLRSDILHKQESVLELVQEAGSIAIFQKKNCAWIEV